MVRNAEKGPGFTDSGETLCVKGTGFTGCGKTPMAKGTGFSPVHKPQQNEEGFSP